MSSVTPPIALPANLAVKDANNNFTAAQSVTGALASTAGLGVFGHAVPGAQPAAPAAVGAAVAATGTTNVTPFGFTTAAQGDALVARVNEIRTTLASVVTVLQGAGITA